MLEARLREVASRQTPSVRPKTHPDRAAKLRCPGCLLELPKGRRGDSCVWCGFVFDAVGERAIK
jgi:hypothetical protein